MAARAGVAEDRPDPGWGIRSLLGVEERLPLGIGQARLALELVVGDHRAQTEDLLALPRVEDVDGSRPPDRGDQAFPDVRVREDVGGLGRVVAGIEGAIRIQVDDPCNDPP